MNPKKHLNFGSLRKGRASVFHDIPDTRESVKIDYHIHDAMMSGFACMYFQDPLLLQFQERLRDAENRDNLQTLPHFHEDKFNLTSKMSFLPIP